MAMPRILSGSPRERSATGMSGRVVTIGILAALLATTTTTTTTAATAALTSTVSDVDASPATMISATPDPMLQPLRSDTTGSDPVIRPAGSTIANRIGGSDRWSTAAQITDRRFSLATEAIIVNGRDFPDGLVASSWSFGLYPVLLVERDQVPTPTRTRLASMLNLTTVRVIGGPGVISDRVVTELAAIANIANPLAVTERVWGTNRYQTAIAVANMVADTGVPSPLSTLVLAVGTDFPDALAAGALSAGLGFPMLLTGGDRLRSDVRNWMTRQRDLTEVLVVGGPNVISDGVLEEIRALKNLSGTALTARRVAGANRFDTAVAVADEVIRRSPTAPNAPSRAVVVNGRNFPDALAAGPLAGNLNVPILLTETDRLPDTTRKWLEDHAGSIFEVVIIGGATAVSAEVERQVRAAATS